MKRRRPGIRSLLLVGGGVLAVALLAGLIVVRFVLTPERLRAETIDTLHEATGRPVELASARLAYAPLGISLQDLQVGSEEEPWLTLPSGLAQLEVLPLLRGRIVLDRVLLESPALVLRAAPPGAVSSSPPANPAATPGRTRSTPVRGSIDELEIRAGTLRWIAPEGGSDFSLGGIDLQAAVQFDDEGMRTDGVLSLRGLDLPALEAYAETIESLEPVIRFDIAYDTADDRVSLESLALDAPPLALTASGEIRDLSRNPHLSLALDSAEQSLESLMPLVPPDLQLPAETEVAGAVALAASFEAALDSPNAAPSVRWNIGFRDVSVTRGSVRLLAAAVGRVTGDIDSVRVEELRGTLGESGTLEAAGVLLPTEDVRVHAELEIADLVRAGLTPEGVEASGRIEADVRSLSQVLSGPVSIRGAAFDGPDLAAPGRNWNLDAELEGADLRIDRLTGKIGTSTLDLTGSVEGLRESPRLTLRGKTPHLDLVELSARADARIAAAGADAPLPPLVPPFPDLPTSIVLSADSVTVEGALWRTATIQAGGQADSGSVRAEIRSADYNGLVLASFQTDLALRGQTARGSFRTPDVDAYGTPLRDVTGAIDLTADRILHLREMKGRAWEGSIQGTADIDLTDPDNPGFDIRTKATNLQADALLSSVVAARNVMQGTLDLESSFTGQGVEPAAIMQALTGSGTFHARDGKIVQTPFLSSIWKTLHLGEKDSLPFRDLITLFRVQNGRILSDSIHVAGTDAVWDVGGSIGFDGTLDYRVRTTLNESLSNTFRSRAGSDLATLLAGTSGPLTLDLNVTGPAAGPTVRIDRSALAERVKKGVGETVKDKVTDKITGGLKGLLGGGAAKAPPDSGG